MSFKRFWGIDWSGARGNRHSGIALAEADVRGRIRFLKPKAGKHWSRTGVLELISAAPAGTAIAIDSSFSLPFEDEARFLPGLADVRDAKALWGRVDAICDGDADLFAGGFVDAFADHFQQSGTPGKQYKRRYRVTEAWANQAFKERCESSYHLIGPSQIGKSGLSTMRLLNRLQHYDHFAIWPFDPIRPDGVTLFEAFATTWRDGFKAKVKDWPTLKDFMNRYQAGLVLDPADKPTDHAADAALMAAGLFSLFARGGKGPYLPAEATPAILMHEGWIMTGEPPCS